MKRLLVLLAAAAMCLAAEAAPHGLLLVVSKQTHVLSLVDGTTLKVTAQIPIGEDPHEVVVLPGNRTAYVSHFGEGVLRSLAAVDLVAGKALADVDISPLQGPHGFALRGGTLWFTADKSKAIAALDLKTGRIVSVLGTGQDRTHMLWANADGSKIIASNAVSGTLSIFDARLDAPMIVPGSPAAPAAYTSPGYKHTLVPTGRLAEGFAVAPDGKEVWVGDADGKIHIIELGADAERDSFDAGTIAANRLAFTPDGKFVVVTQKRGKDLVVIDAKSHAVVHRVPIEENGASGIQMQPDGRRVFIACPRDHFVAVVDLKTWKRVATIDAGREPDGLAWWLH
jgi:DNA-binding beta-propeller fold protein YncE